MIALLNTANSFRDCADILDRNPNARSGIYTIQPVTCPGPQPNSVCYFNVWCDQDTDGGGWTVRLSSLLSQLKMFTE